MQFKVKAARSGEGMVYVDIDALTKDDAMRQAAERGFYLKLHCNYYPLFFIFLCYQRAKQSL